MEFKVYEDFVLKTDVGRNVMTMSELKDSEFNSNQASAGYLNMFKRRMRRLRSLYFNLTIFKLMILFIVLAVFILFYQYIVTVNFNRQICTTDNCLRSAKLFAESMNRSVDPCENFYEFACGNFDIVHKIPKTSISSNRISELNSLTIKHIRDFLEKEDCSTEPHSVAESRIFYRSCVATEKMHAAGLDPLIRILDKIGLRHLGYPTDLQKNDTSLTSILANVKKILNIDYLFKTTVGISPKNQTVNMITVGQPLITNVYPVDKKTEKLENLHLRKIWEVLTFKKKLQNGTDEIYNQDNFVLKSYTNYFNDVWSEIYKYKFKKNNPHKFDLNTVLHTILLFEKSLSKINNEIKEPDEESSTIMTVDELQTFTDNILKKNLNIHYQIIDWKQYFMILFMDIKHVTLDFNNDLIQIRNIEYFEALFHILSKNPKNIILMNIWWEVVKTIIPYTTNQMRFIQKTYYENTFNVIHIPSRSLYCANVVNSIMGMAVSHLLVHDTELIEYNKKMMNDMMNNIQWAFKQIVKELKWMDDITKKKTLYKAHKMKTLVGFPEFINDPENVDLYYSEFDIRENDFFGNIIRYMQLFVKTNLKELRQLNYMIKNSWVSDPLEINAYNWIPANAINVPSGILQFPFFGHDLQVLNYGFLGFIVGHEFTHSFDNTGRKYDPHGNKNMWWTNNTINEYKKRINCFIEHYDSYILPGVEEKVNGERTLDENIADNGGLREAFMAYRKYVADNGEEPKLLDLYDFTNEQVFYLAFANSWCEVTTYQSKLNSLLDTHSPNYVRVMAALINSEEFSEIWKCKKGTKMNPFNKKCKIW